MRQGSLQGGGEFPEVDWVGSKFKFDAAFENFVAR